MTVAPSSNEMTAYGCFGFCGIITLVFVGLDFLANSLDLTNTGLDTTAGATLLGILIVIPIIMASIAVAGAGIVLSLIVRRVRLLLLSAMTVAFALVSVASLEDSPLLDPLNVYAAPITYGVLVTGIPAHWLWSVSRN